MVFWADSGPIKYYRVHDNNAGDTSFMSQISRTGLKKSQLEKGLKKAETKAAYWKKKALAYKQALDIVENAELKLKLEEAREAIKEHKRRKQSWGFEGADYDKDLWEQLKEQGE